MSQTQQQSSTLIGRPKTIRTIKMDTMPDWMDDETQMLLREFSNNGVMSVRFTPAEQHVLTKQKQMPISQWSEKYRILEASSIRGRWQNIYTPYLVDIMDAANMPGVETVIMCKSPQTGGSECGHNLVGYCIDRLPGPVMYVFPDEKTARENARDRIIPMITSSPKLSKYLTGNADDMSMYHIALVHMHIYLAWAGSVSRLGNKPIRVLILDELDKYSDPVNEARSEDLATKRTTTWRSRRKIFKISTPTTVDGPIWQAFTEEANCRFRYYVECPDCKKMHMMEFKNISWPNKGEKDEPKAEEVYSKNLAYYVCPECGSCWTDDMRNEAVRNGCWREEETKLSVAKYIEEYQPKKVGFHVPAWLSYFVSLSEIAMAYLKYSQTDDLAEYKNFQNQYAAEPWRQILEMRSEESVLERCDDRPRGMVPGPIDGKPRVVAIFAGVDTMLRWFRYVIRAVGFGNPDESWLIECGAAYSFEELEEKLIHRTFTDAEGTEYKVKAIIIDAMGERQRTYAVYNWARQYNGYVFVCQGSQRLNTATWRMTNLEYYPTVDSKTMRIPGGLQLYRLDTTYYKNMLAAKMAIPVESPGAFHLHNNADDNLAEYVKEMTAEEWDPEEKGGMWVMNSKSKGNHAWDCEYYIQALADILQVRTWGVEKKERPKVVPVQKPISVTDRLSRFRARR